MYQLYNRALLLHAVRKAWEGDSITACGTYTIFEWIAVRDIGIPTCLECWERILFKDIRGDIQRA